MIKPRIKRVPYLTRGNWVCHGDNAMGVGFTAREAYSAWIRMIVFKAEMGLK